ncbi:alkaline phosphatase D [Armatimonadetes bacterium GBS]|jgi:alkaline phosphatase D|nr:Alkaline phosphatase D [bacterium HR14]GIV13752.1 MAG: alkaline phosphatase [Fimbriimonadales bacterium]CUU04309.1 alkaline phosphatase D [Armatimonadetes bacterium GBS]CUU35763.1 alkaline phosphatase D [Armatimonadetes bacterium GXS]
MEAMRRYGWSLWVLLCVVSVFAQPHPLLNAGPMLAYAEMTETAIWVQTTRPATVQIRYWQKGRPETSRLTPPIHTNAEGDHIALFRLTNLPFGTRFEYELYIDGERVARDYPLEFQTQPHWRWRTEPPEFSFAVGSCAYFNDPVVDRPGAPYGGDYEIFLAIHRLRPDFMLWLGDNIYYVEPDWLTESGMRHRWRMSRRYPELQPLLASTHHYAIWDDHDYGPNDSDSSYRLKDVALKVFADYFPQVRYGLPEAPGCFYRFEWGDVEFFMLDDRTYRTPNKMSVSPEKRMLGKAQMEWLKNALRNSQATFKIIANGGQMINPMVYFEGFGLFPEEQKELLDFIVREKITGVVFLSGDRHMTELLRVTPPGGYPLYELTCSPLTSGPARGHPAEANNPARVEGTWVTQRNFALIKVRGKRGERELVLGVYDKDGNRLWERTLNERELRW